MALIVINEDWIRNRVHIEHDNLDNVRSVSLPGTYHEKISGFGDSLKHFSRLKSLDVSRNAIESLSGLESLKLLEKLNLYYNNISSLEELGKLRSLTKLQELDLRLNPVSRIEPDYRLFLVHMLPELRQLDDRAVRDLERKAALLHFSTDQATQFSSHRNRPLSPKQRPNPRVEHVKSLGKTPLYYTGDDEALLSEMIRTEGDFSRRIFTGSTSKTPFSDDYPPEVIRQMNKGFLTSDTGDLPTTMKSFQNVQNYVALADDKAPADVKFALRHTAFGVNVEEIQDRYPNLYPFIVSSSDGKDLTKPKDQSSVLRTNQVQNANFSSSTDAVAHFTPSPALLPQTEILSHHSKAVGQNPDVSEDQTVNLHRSAESGSKIDASSCPPSEETLPLPCSAASHISNDGSIALDGVFLESLSCDDRFLIRISDLADKYWNGSKSLLKNQRFRNNLTDLISSLRAELAVRPDATGAGDPRLSGDTACGSPNLFIQKQLDQLRNELSKARDENTRLHERLVGMTMDSGRGDDVGSGLTPDENKLKSSLIKAQRDVSILRNRLEQANEERKVLNESLAKLQATTALSQPVDTLENRAEIDVILFDNERLRSENQMLKNRLNQSLPPMQELTSMLRDSHRSLVQTNEHLLQELNTLKHCRSDGTSIHQNSR